MSTDDDSPHANRRPMPFTRLELCVLSLVDGELQVLLARRASEPYKGRWALPGGVLRIDLDATLDAGAQRVAQERLGTGIPALQQLCAVGRRFRDPRSTWALSVVYRAMCRAEDLELSAGKRVQALRWMPVEEAAEATELAFDHAEVIRQALKIVREETGQLVLPAGLLPRAFTLGELQQICEVLGGRRLDKSSFRRRLADRELVQPLEGELRRGANRPAQLYGLAGGMEGG